MGKDIARGPQERRFAAYTEGLAEAAGHVERNVPLKGYCTALLLPGERKSVAHGRSIGSRQRAPVRQGSTGRPRKTFTARLKAPTSLS